MRIIHSNYQTIITGWHKLPTPVIEINNNETELNNPLSNRNFNK